MLICYSLIFPQWDMVTVILCVFLLSYVYGEGKVRKPDHIPVGARD